MYCMAKMQHIMSQRLLDIFLPIFDASANSSHTPSWTLLPFHTAIQINFIELYLNYEGRILLISTLKVDGPVA